MRLPTVRGIIDRRILVNLRIDPEVLARVLPPPFQPQLVNGNGIAGVCLIRLKHIRPRFVPPWMGISSENAAHRIAVQWSAGGTRKTGVYIPRRDTSSLLNVFAGGRVFPGTHHHARFEVREGDDRYQVSMHSRDNSAYVRVDGHVTDDLPETSVFASLAEALEFFEAGSLGYSPAAASGRFDGLELRSFGWQVQPLAIDKVESSFFEDEARFPSGAAAYDSALLMRGIDHEWHGRQPLCCATGPDGTVGKNGAY